MASGRPCAAPSDEERRATAATPRAGDDVAPRYGEFSLYRRAMTRKLEPLPSAPGRAALHAQPETMQYLSSFRAHISRRRGGAARRRELHQRAVSNALTTY